MEQPRFLRELPRWRDLAPEQRKLVIGLPIIALCVITLGIIYFPRDQSTTNSKVQQQAEAIRAEMQKEEAAAPPPPPLAENPDPEPGLGPIKGDPGR